jgi:hypothetical protein
MPKLTDTQLVILTAAAKHDDRSVLPLPKPLKLRGGAATAAPLKSLLNKDLIAERPAKAEEEVWREGIDSERTTLVITDAGLNAIGVEPEVESGGPNTKVPTKPKTPRKAKTRSSKEAGSAPAPLPSTPPGDSGQRSDASPAGSANARPGTKQALLIDLLKRKDGATIDELVQATGWQAHSVRGAISGTLKKKLGLAVTSEKVEGRGRVYRIVDTV